MVLGIVSAKVVYSKTNNSKEKEEGPYFLQLGVYLDEDSMKNDIRNIDNKLILKENDKYYVYVGISNSKNNLKK